MMNNRLWLGFCAGALALAMSPMAMAQPETKLTSRLEPELVAAIWCSSVYFEHAYAFAEGSAEAVDFEQRAFDIGDVVDESFYAAGMRDAEIDEIWSVYDAAAFDIAHEDGEEFAEHVRACEAIDTANAQGRAGIDK